MGAFEVGLEESRNGRLRHALKEIISQIRLILDQIVFKTYVVFEDKMTKY